MFFFLKNQSFNLLSKRFQSVLEAAKNFRSLIGNLSSGIPAVLILFQAAGGKIHHLIGGPGKLLGLGFNANRRCRLSNL